MMTVKKEKVSRRFQLQTAIDVPGYLEITEGLTKRGLFRKESSNSRFHLTASQATTIACMMILDGKDGEFVENLPNSKTRIAWNLKDASEGFDMASIKPIKETQESNKESVIIDEATSSME